MWGLDVLQFTFNAPLKSVVMKANSWAPLFGRLVLEM